VEDLVNAKLEAQQAEFQAALDELHGICQESFATIQSSFQDVDSWKEEVTDTFAAIQSWASDVEKRVLASSAAHATPSLPKNRFLGARRSSPFSSTPSGREAIQSHQTPAVEPIPTGAPLPKRVRLSDASECSLATIPEQLMTPNGELVDEDPMLGAQVSQGRAGDGEQYNSIEKLDAAKQEQQENAAQPLRAADQSQNLASDTVKEADTSARSPMDVMTTVQMRNARDEAMRTPAAAKTLFGTERSADERFEDTGRVSDISSHSTEWGIRPPLWLQRV
jgi:hypothetical protein